MSTSGSGQSSVGSRAIYEAGDQRNVPQAELNERARYAEGQTHSHKNLDSKDQRSIANKLASQENKPESDHHHNFDKDPEAELSKQDPTKPAKLHGNAPSKGAQIDAELQAEDEQRLKEKGIKK
ncbi:uncharacterized protein BO97DRAFT_469017 [Aspergillus homomorphus CBS 101889]|uniref:Uncharacterized protein n=1 Tax=Aspergillus homomorphus (strain CBS 101889) TaxID=1450537 RepID=A0A395I336_ASPHC|nr:hypothetical protein BO97DRAFT_469017 [Aspergillus homomorphus CBS 101889]RAL14611.1 hypothetical protein BO97DRAFT_469017 [Aspergillus homomorphus CBS 101889]